MVSPAIKDEDFRYQVPPEDILIEYKDKIANTVKQISSKLHLDDYDIEINLCLLNSIIIRIDERKDYYRYFHSTETKIMKISRGKELALLAYWIVKYKPFRIRSIAKAEEFYCKYRCSFNEVYAAMSIVSFVVEKTTFQGDFFTSNKINTMIYDLFNRDISKEAMIMYIESFISDGSEE